MINSCFIFKCIVFVLYAFVFVYRIAVHSNILHCESKKNWATFIFTVTLANVGRFLNFFQCRNQKEMAHNKNEKFPTVP